MKQFFINLLLIVSGIMLPILVLELGFRIVGKPEWDPAAVVGWRYQGDDTVLNEFRFRGQQIAYSDSDFVVVLLGDSQVEANGCNANELPEQFLQQKLNAYYPNIKVFTIGSGGYGFDQQMLALQEYFGTHRADMVILWQTFGNDVWNNLFPTHWPKDGLLKPTYWLRYGQLRGPNYIWGDTLQQAAKTKLGVFINRTFHPQRNADLKWEKMLPPPYKPTVNYDGQVVTDWDPNDNSNINPQLNLENLDNEKTHYAVDLVPVSERTQYALDLSRALLSAIDSTCRINNSKLVLFNYDDYVTVVDDDTVAHKVNNLIYFTSNAQRKQNQSYMTEGFDQINLFFPHDTLRMSPTDAHLNCEGNKMMMHKLGEEIIKRATKKTILSNTN